MSPLPAHLPEMAGGLAGLLGTSAYLHWRAGEWPAALTDLQEPAMRLLDRVRRPGQAAAGPPVPYRRVGLLPHTGFTSSLEDADRLADLLVRAHEQLGAGLAGRALLQIEWHADEGRVATMWHAAEPVCDLLEQAWSEERLLVVDADTLTEDGLQVGEHRRHAELTLTRGAGIPVTVDLREDLARLVAHVYAGLDPARHEYAIVQAGLLPLPPHEVNQLRAEAHDLPASVGEHERAKAELVLTQRLFNVQVLVATWSDDARRARSLRDKLLTSISALWSSPNRWEQAPARDDDRAAEEQRLTARMGHGLWAPARVLVLGTRELTGWLLPPAEHTAPNLLRADDLRPADGDPVHDSVASTGEGDRDEAAAPPPLRRYTGQADLVPLGEITTPRGDELVGVPLDDLLFAFTGGQAGYGKTTSAIGRFLHLVTRTRWRGQPLGGLFLDPHEDALHLIKRYLAALGQDDRIVEVTLTSPTQVGWNLFAVDHAREIPDRAGAIVSAMAAACGWSSNTAGNLIAGLNAAAHVVLELALAVRESGRPHLTPTLFQIPTLFNDPEWREQALAFCDDGYLAHQLQVDRPHSITSPIMRLRARPEAVGLLGNPTSGYDVRAAMDDGHIVLVGPAVPGADDDLQRLIANLFTLDLLRAALSRRDIRNPANRRPFWAFLDEAHNYDGSGSIRRLLSEARKYGIRAEILTQYPSQLREETWRALDTNAGQILTTALGATDATALAKRWRGISPQTITALGRHEFLAQVTLDGHKNPRPFRVRSIQPPFDAPADDDRVAELDAALDERLGRRPVDDVIAELNGRGQHTSLDQRLFDWMRRHSPRGRVMVSDRTSGIDIQTAPTPTRAHNLQIYRGDRT